MFCSSEISRNGGSMGRGGTPLQTVYSSDGGRLEAFQWQTGGRMKISYFRFPFLPSPSEICVIEFCYPSSVIQSGNVLDHAPPSLPLSFSLFPSLTHTLHLF